MKITVCGGVVGLTNFKRNVLDFEYNGFQKWMIFGIDEGIYSSYKVSKKWNFKKIKYREYPLYLWSKLTKFEFKPNNTIAPYWLRFRTKLKRGGIWIGIKTKQSIPKKSKLCDSFLIKNSKGNYEVKLLFEIPDAPIKKFKNILAVDFGEKRIATVVSSKDRKPIFLGKEVRGIRRHYSYLRKKLGRKKLNDKIKSLGNKEKNIINGILHNISNFIIAKSIKDKSCIVIGNLKGIRKNSKGKRFNRIVSNMPYFKLTQMIMYKAQIKGIKVIKINERGTSRLCHRCSSIGIRNKQSVFKCSNCKVLFDADWNACLNILNRSKELVSLDGAMAFSPKTAPREAVSTFNNL